MVPPLAPEGACADLLATAAWAALLDHLERAWPCEACGLILGAGEKRRVVPLENDLGSGTRAQSAFRIDPLALLAELSAAERQGERLLAIFHSHPRGGAAFSEEDRREALAPDGTPWWPGIDYLVVAVEQGRAWEARAFRWDGARFAGRELRLPGR